MNHSSYDVVVVGGGFFGVTLALRCSLFSKRVLILEQEDELLLRASYNNQARVHGGYHYPRSLMTGLRSQANYNIFKSTYLNAIEDTFEKYYAIARTHSAVSSQQFKLFCERIAAPLQRASPNIKAHFNSSLIDEVFHVEECAFNARALRDSLKVQAEQKGVEVSLSSKVVRISELDSLPSPAITVQQLHTNQVQEISAKMVFLCAYAGTNSILADSNLPIIPLQHELTELCLVDLPDALRNVGITVMCGPFFSSMPFPSENCHSLSHVRYTPHHSWRDILNNNAIHYGLHKDVRSHHRSSFLHMIKDASRYLPVLKETQYRCSLWEVKSVLPRSETDDSRPILLKTNHGLKNLHCVIGAKIDNVFDVLKALEQANIIPV